NAETRASGLALRAGSGLGSAVREEVEAPVVAPQEASRRVLELVLAEEREAELAADRVRGPVLHRRVGMHEPMAPLGPRFVDELGGRRARDTSPLEARDHGPPDLPDLLVAPCALPVADPPDRLGARFDDDPVLARVLLVPGLPLGQLLGILGATQVPRHLRVTERLPQEPQVALTPRLDANV